jgi:ankyrin repeat protein
VRSGRDDERFKHAVHRRDVAELRRLIPYRHELRAVVNAPIFDFDSPAIVAVAGSGSVDLIDALLQLGADPNRRSDWWAGGFHALYSANAAVAERLLEAGAIPDACAASQMDRIDLLREMLRADPSRVHERGGDGQTPLHFARSREVADLLLDAGAAIDAADVDHRSTPAEWMIGGGDAERPRVELARYLVDRGASTDIFLAAALGLTSRVRELLERDPSLLALRTGLGEYGERPPSSYHIYYWTIGPNMSPLQTALRFGHDDTVRAMVQLASPVQQLLAACDAGDATAASQITREHPGLVERLTGDDRRALTYAAWHGNAPAVSLMLQLGFDPSQRAATGPAGGTALHCAAWQGSAESVEALLSYPSGRALLETRDTQFNGTPFGWCCHGSLNCGSPSANHAEVAKLLLAAGSLVERAADEMDASDAVKAVVREFVRRA